jgi:hypothetical protein
VVVAEHDGEKAGGIVIGFHCPMCGSLLPVQADQPDAVPLCAGSRARTGQQHQPTRMQALRERGSA